MRAILSGSAAVALVEGRDECLLSVGARKRQLKHADRKRLFAGAVDVRAVEVQTLGEIENALQNDWAADRALRLTLLFLDPSEPGDGLADYASCIEELLETKGATGRVERVLTHRAMEGLGDLERANSPFMANFPAFSALLQQLVRRQEAIVRIDDAFTRIRQDAFPDDITVSDARWELVEGGAFLELANCIETGSDLNFARLTLASTYPQYREVIARWTAALSPGLAKLPRKRSAQTEIPEDWDDEPDVDVDGHIVLAEVRERQRNIRAALKMLDIERARTLTEELIAHQRGNSSADQIAKSLSNLSKQAKAEEVFSLEVDWAKWATEENPADPRTFAHLADALIHLRRFDEAYGVLDSLERAGDPAYAAIVRARILRLMGRYTEARTAFLDTAKLFDGSEGIAFAYAGAAECLRDLGRLDEALSEYEALTHQWPFEETFWNGLASVYMDVGRFDEAVSVFGKAANVKDSPVSKNGRATVAKLAGRFSDAKNGFAEVLKVHPNNSVALIGRAECLRGEGKYREAVEAFDLAIQRAPDTPQVWAGKLSLLNQLGRRAEALTISLDVMKRFPDDYHFRVARARIYKGMGDWHEALAEVDQAAVRMPDVADIQILRAEILHRLGEPVEAFRVIDAVVANQQNVFSALTAKAAMKLADGAVDEAEAALPTTSLRTQWDWSRYILNGQIQVAKGNHRAAFRHFSQGLRKCPFARQKSYLKEALVSLELRQGRFKEARRLLEAPGPDVSNVIQLHVFAASHRPGRARAELEKIRKSESPAEVISLAEEIARRHRLVDEKPSHDAAWIHAMQQRNLALDIAA